MMESTGKHKFNRVDIPSERWHTVDTVKLSNWVLKLCSGEVQRFVGPRNLLSMYNT